MNLLNSKVAFGIDIRKKLNGSDLYVKTFQIASMLPVLYLITASGYLGLFAKGGPLAWLFELGMSALPRWMVLGLSYLYRATSSEVIALFAMLVIALFLGLFSNKIFRKDEARGIRARKVFMVLISLDLVLRVLPFGFNMAFGLPFEVIGFAVRLLSVAALYMDIKAHKAKE